METQSNGRIKEFKTGLGDTEDVVKRHAEKAISLRKDKRDDKIQRMRRRQTQEEQKQSKIPDKFQEQAFAARDVFLRTGSMESLVFIQRYLRCMDDEDINNLLDDQGLLASSMVTLLTHPNIQYVVIASDCLVNITGSVNVQKISSVAAIMTKTNFISIAHQHINTNQNNGGVSPIRLDMWMCIANMACLCQDARNILLQTSIFRNFNTNQNSTPPPPPPPFMSELISNDLATLPIILLILEGFCAEKESVPNEPFIMAHWRLICNLLYTICPPPMKDTQMDDDQLKHLSMILLIINSTLKKVSSEFCIRLLAIERPLISFLVNLAQRTEKELVNQIRILQTLVHIGLQNVPQYEFQNIMREAGCIQLMSALSHSGNERVRREAMMWIGNYASECFQFVKHLIDCRAFDGVTTYLQHPSQPALVSQAIYVLAAASQSCYRNSGSVLESNETLKVLLGQNKWLCHTSHRIGRRGCDDVTLDILSLWINLIKWDKHFIVPLLEETGGLSKVDELLASKNPAIWKLANSLDELLQQYNNNNNEEMDTMN